MNEQIKKTIKKAMESKYCIDPLNFNIWARESLAKYNKKIALMERTLTIQTYLEGRCRY